MMGQMRDRGLDVKSFLLGSVAVQGCEAGFSEEVRRMREKLLCHTSCDRPHTTHHRPQIRDQRPALALVEVEP
ncbi:hypothetical protein AALO_G00155340 [Alosa alosa]|uniref:Uncharacterized protein n=1 Tax=Alosa alosa TaxID=278164 RepID=A0AAV6GK94_9TELE|nr:hypothetical protein AALO_G00155340 [Alosa alosa]